MHEDKHKNAAFGEGYQKVGQSELARRHLQSQMKT